MFHARLPPHFDRIYNRILAHKGSRSRATPVTMFIRATMLLSAGLSRTPCLTLERSSARSHFSHAFRMLRSPLRRRFRSAISDLYASCMHASTPGSRVA